MNAQQLLADAKLAIEHLCKTCAVVNNKQYDPELVQKVLDDIEGHFNPRCAVLNCTNTKKQGKFIGNLCGPCYAFVRGNSSGNRSQIARNVQQQNSSNEFVENLHTVIGKYLKEQK
jgi:hypothetical protein